MWREDMCARPASLSCYADVGKGRTWHFPLPDSGFRGGAMWRHKKRFGTIMPLRSVRHFAAADLVSLATGLSNGFHKYYPSVGRA
jgi:hypothetical protein